MVSRKLGCMPRKKLRLFVQNRVSTILRMVQWSIGLDVGDPLPLYHVEGELNVTDLLTKGHSLHHCTGCD